MATTTPEAHGATGNGTTDDTVAIKAAIATGMNVEFDSRKRYKITDTLAPSTRGQVLFGGGLKPVGAFDAIKVAGVRDVVIDLTMYCAGQTAGYAVMFQDNAERCTVRKLFIEDHGFRGIGVQQCNTITIDYFYGINMRGDVGIRWYGTPAMRSDVLNIRNAFINFAAGVTDAIGLDWFGNCHSLTVDNLHVVGQSSGVSPVRHGVFIRANDGEPIPQIGRLHNVATDFTRHHGIHVFRGDDIDIVSPYVNGSQTGSGIVVDEPSKNAVRVIGGKSIGTVGYGVYSSNGAFVSGLMAYANGLANSGGTITGPGVITP